MVDSPRLLLLDGHSLAYRAFYALPVENFSTTTGQATNAVYGFTAMLINTIRDERPTHLAVAFDVSRQNFRTDAFPEYKANRAKSPDEFAGQVELIKDVLEALDISTLAMEGYEADDVLATLTTEALDQGYEVLILSGDRDTLQLVTPSSTVLYPVRGVSELARMTPRAVQDKYGVPPQQYPDIAAIVGETSDNLPGVPGVGPGFASRWLNRFGSLDALCDRADELTGKKGESFREHLAQVLTNRQLNGLLRDLDLPVAIDDLERGQFDRQRIHEVFDSLQFRVLRERLFDYLDQDVAHEAEALAVDVAVLGPDEVAGWLDAHRPRAGQDEPFGLAFDGQWGRGTGELLSIAIAAPGGDVACVLLSDSTAADSAALRNWLADPGVPKAVHDAKGPMLALAALGWTLEGLVVDTVLAAYLALPGQRSFDLADLVARFLGLDLAGDDGEPDQLALEGTDDDRPARWGARASAVAGLAAEFVAQLRDVGTLPLLTELEIPLAGVLADMEAAGIGVDVADLTALEAEFAAHMRDAESMAHQIAGRAFNLGSPKQLQEVLFQERALPKTKRIKTGHTTDAEALQKLFAQTQDPLLEEILRWRDVSKMRQTVAGLIPVADRNSRIHTTFNQTIAATGRLSSTDPNLQNIPVRTTEGRRIRAAFEPGPGYESLLTADYSQIEMRIMAHLSGDEGLIAAFQSGEDLHSTVAAQVFGGEPDAVDAEMRRRIKAMSYGLAYGLSAFGLGSQLGISPEEARGLMQEYFERFGGIRDYLAHVVDVARVNGYTETMLGRRRYLPDLNSDNRQRRQMAERMALNAPIQGSAADIIKVAMIEVHRAMREERVDSRMLLQVHDELVVEVAPGEEAVVTRIVRERMGAAADLAVPLDVSVGVGPDWNSAAH